MSDWHDVALGDVCELKRGYDLPIGSRRDGPISVVSSSGPTGWHDKAKVAAPGVVTGRYGTLGQVFYVTEDFWPLNTALYVRDFKGNDPRYVAALLRSMDLKRHDGAAAVPGLNRNQLHTLPVRVPAVPVQRAIANVVQAFDDLIENNRRRVDLAPYVGADLDVMRSDAEVFRGNKPFVMTNLVTDEGLDGVIEWIRRDVLMSDLV